MDSGGDDRDDGGAGFLALAINLGCAKGHNFSLSEADGRGHFNDVLTRRFAVDGSIPGENSCPKGAMANTPLSVDRGVMFPPFSLPL